MPDWKIMENDIEPSAKCQKRDGRAQSTFQGKGPIKDKECACFLCGGASGSRRKPPVPRFIGS